MIMMVRYVKQSVGTKPDYFANGGDRGKSNTPEQAVCDELGVELLWGVGGDYKADASSSLVERVRNTDVKDSDSPPRRVKGPQSER